MSKPVEQKAPLSSWYVGPGPATVMLPPTIGMINHDPSRKQMPAFSLGLKLGSKKWGNSQSPGPIYGIPEGMTAKGPKSNVAYSIKSRTIIKELGAVGPGPAAYLPDINLNRRKAPEFSLGWRTRLNEKGRYSPGPIYLLPSCLGPRVPDKPAAGECSIKSRTKTNEECFRSPGPIYDIGSPNLIKNKGGEVSVKGRWRELKAQSCNAGPASYNVNIYKIAREPPAFSLGIRHTPFAGVFRTECDKVDDQNFDDC